MKTYKEFEAIKWYKDGKFTVDDTWVEPVSDWKFVTFDNFKKVYILEEILNKKQIYLHDRYKHEPSNGYKILSQDEVEKYVYSNWIEIHILSPNRKYLYKDLPQEIKDRL